MGKTFLEILIKPGWKWFVSMPLELLGVLSFVNPDWGSVINYPELSKYISWYWFVIVGLFILGIATAWESAKIISGAQNKHKSRKLVEAKGQGRAAGRDFYETNKTYNVGIGSGITDKELIVQIGVAVQDFLKAFNQIPYASRDNRVDVYNNALEIFNDIETKLYHRARIVLSNTPILQSLEELKQYFEKYQGQLLLYWSYDDQEMEYIKDKSPIPNKLESKTSEIRLTLDTYSIAIGMTIEKIVEISKNRGMDWLIS